MFRNIERIPYIFVYCRKNLLIGFSEDDTLFNDGISPGGMTSLAPTVKEK